MCDKPIQHFHFTTQISIQLQLTFSLMKRRSRLHAGSDLFLRLPNMKDETKQITIPVNRMKTDSLQVSYWTWVTIKLIIKCHTYSDPNLHVWTQSRPAKAKLQTSINKSIFGKNQSPGKPSVNLLKNQIQATSNSYQDVCKHLQWNVKLRMERKKSQPPPVSVESKWDKG